MGIDVSAQALAPGLVAISAPLSTRRLLLRVRGIKCAVIEALAASCAYTSATTHWMSMRLRVGNLTQSADTTPSSSSCTIGPALVVMCPVSWRADGATTDQRPVLHGESPTTTDGTFVLQERNERPYVASIAARRFNDIKSSPTIHRRSWPLRPKSGDCRINPSFSRRSARVGRSRQNRARRAEWLGTSISKQVLS